MAHRLPIRPHQVDPSLSNFDAGRGQVGGAVLPMMVVKRVLTRCARPHGRGWRVLTDRANPPKDGDAKARA